MSSPTVFDSLEAYLRANWTATELVFENEPWPLEDAPENFVYVEIFGQFYSQQSIGQPGDNLWREEGTMLLHVMTKNDTGTREARSYAKGLVDLFRETEVDGIRFRDMSIGGGEPGRATGNYFPMTASVEWERDD